MTDAGDVLLRALRTNASRASRKRREPEAVVDQVGVAQSNVLLVVFDFAVKSKCFELAVSLDDERAAGCFVTATGLYADEAVFNQVNATDGVAGADFVEEFDQLDRLEVHAVD